MRLAPILHAGLDLLQMHPMTMGFRGTRNHSFRRNLARLNLVQKIRFCDRSNGFGPTKETFLHEKPICRHRSYSHCKHSNKNCKVWKTRNVKQSIAQTPNNRVSSSANGRESENSARNLAIQRKIGLERPEVYSIRPNHFTVGIAWLLKKPISDAIS
jgi:hypothetical protein